MEALGIIEYLIGFIRMEYVIIIPTLMGIGIAIKNTKKIRDEYIPITLMLIGIGFGVALGSLTSEPLVHSVMQGIISSWATSWGYETFKQLEKAREDKRVILSKATRVSQNEEDVK